MSHGLQWELTLLQDRWQATYREDAARLRLYQRELPMHADYLPAPAPASSSCCANVRPLVD
ncbi:TPA: hypothetical protein ACSP1Y_004452 [Aeromonas hydrophila]